MNRGGVIRNSIFNRPGLGARERTRGGPGGGVSGSRRKCALIGAATGYYPRMGISTRAAGDIGG